MKTLVLFSGGTDSSYILYKLLKETDDEVTALLLEKKFESEVKIAFTPDYNFRVPKLVEELRKIRHFEYIKKIVTDDEINPETDHYYTYFITWAAPYLNSGVYDRIVTGRTSEQHDQTLFPGSKLKGTPALYASMRLFRKLTTRGELWNPLASDEWHKKFGKPHIFKYLPKEIFQYTFSCNHPITIDNGTWNEPCKKCYKCLWDDKVIELMNKGYSEEAIDAWRRIKTLEYGDGKGISAPMRFWLPLEMKRGNILMGLNSKEKVKRYVTDGIHYTRKWRKEEGIWDFSDIKKLEEDFPFEFPPSSYKVHDHN